MTRLERRQFLQRELVQTEYFLAQTEGHPLMAPQFVQKAARLREELELLPVDGPEARTVLFFGGKPVKGSVAISAEFVSEILSPFVEIVKSQYAASKHGRVGERGPRKDEDEARLMLSGTPRGSFGLELTPPGSDDPFAEGRLADVLVRVTHMIEASAKSDEAFLLALDDITDRAFPKFTQFFKVLKDHEASFRMRTGDIEFELGTEEVRVAHERVSTSKVVFEDVEIPGTFRGAGLDSWRFDFRTEKGEPLSGKIDADRTEDDVALWLQSINEPVIGSFRQVTRITSGNVKRISHVLVDIRGPASPS